MNKTRSALIKEIKNVIHEELTQRRDQEIKYVWDQQARPSQREPTGDWHTWLILAGRGFGKTRVGAETLRQWVAQKRYRRIALIADTESDAREVMIEGESGLLAVHSEEERPRYEPSKRRLVWKNGAIATVYSAENYEKLRGPQFDAAWVDELAKFRHAEKIWQQLQFSLRLGTHPKVIITTTPRALPLLTQLMSQEGQGLIVTRGSTFENKNNLAPSFLSSIEQKYANTRLGLQELYGEILTSSHQALWCYETLDKLRITSLPSFKRLVVALDPAVTNLATSDETGIIVAGLSLTGEAYILEDLSGRYSPLRWAEIAVEAYHRWHADRLVAEINKGGDLVEKVIRAVDPLISYKGLHASRGKLTRAEPVAALYEQGKVFHVTTGLAQLERQLCTYTGNKNESSPDRLDALVWAVTELMFESFKHTTPHLWKI